MRGAAVIVFTNIRCYGIKITMHNTYERKKDEKVTHNNNIQDEECAMV